MIIKFIKYNNGENSKLIENVKRVTVVDYYIIATLETNVALKILLKDIESIVDDTVLLKGEWKWMLMLKDTKTKKL